VTVDQPFTPRLSFPRPYGFDIRWRDGRYCILDRTRRRFVALTPEEWVRQNLLEFLVRDRGCPRALTAVETALEYSGRPFRADVIVHARNATPLLLAECKEPGARLDQSVLDQVDTYNQVVHARYLLVTNGHQHSCWHIEPARGAGRFIDVLPTFDDM
jgi:hypothetical protein